MSALEKIDRARENFTFQEARIYQLLQKDTQRFVLSPIGDIAQQLQISKTTLMRFAKGCGFTGYAELRKQLQRELFLVNSPAHKMQEIITQDYSLSPDDLALHDQANIKETYENFNKNDLQKAVQLIGGAKEIHTLSWGISGHLAEMFTIRTRLLGIRCSMIKRHLGILLEETAHLHQDDVVILFEFPPYSKEILETVESLKKRGVHIILVTDSNNCPAISYAEVSFFCITDTLFFGNSFVAPLFWVNLITSLVMDTNREYALAALKRQQDIFNKKRYYQ